jgi:PAS domain S-box-containing protein
MRSLFASLRARLILLVFLALAPAFALIVYDDHQQRQWITQDAEGNVLRLTRLIAADQEQVILSARQLLVALAQTNVVSERYDAACSALFADLLKEYALYANLGAADADGNIFCSALPLSSPVNIADRLYFQRALQTRDFAVGEYQIGRITGQHSLNVGYPVLDASGRAQGVVFIALNLAWLDQFAAHANLPPGSVFNVTDRNHTILARYPNSERWIGKTMPESSLVRAMTGQESGTTEALGVDGTLRLYAFTVIHSGTDASNVRVTVGIPSDLVFAERNRTTARNLIALGVVAGLALGAAWFFGEWFILRRVRALENVVAQLSAGNLDARTDEPYGESELSDLARRFDEMAAALQQREKEHAESKRALQKWADIFNTTNVGIVVGSPETGTLEMANPAFARMHGYTVEELRGKPLRELYAPVPDAVAQDIRQAVEKHGHHIFESRNVRRDGSVFPALVEVVAVEGSQGQPPYWIASVQDITGLRHAEEEAREQQTLAESLRDAAAALNSTLNFDEVLDYILDNVGRVVPHVMSSIMLIEGDIARVVRNRYQDLGDSEELVTGKKLTIAKTPNLRHILETRQPLTIPDTRAYPGWIDHAATRWIRSHISAPILIKDQVIGFLNVSSRIPNFYSATHAARLQAFADQAAIALENARLMAEAERRADAFAALYDSARDLSQQHELKLLLETIVERAAMLLHASHGGIYLHDPARGDVELVTQKGFPVPPGTRLQMGEGMAGKVAQTRQPLIVDDYRTWEHRSPQYADIPFTAVIQVPMLHGGEFIGVLSIAEIERTDRRFTEADAHLLTLFAGQAAAAVHSARVIQEAQTRADRLALLYDAGLALNSVLDPRVQLEFLFKIAMRALNAERAEFFRFDASENRLVLELALGFDKKKQDVLDRLRFAVDTDGGFAVQVYRERVPLNVGDVQADPRWVVVDDRIRSGLWVPVRHEDQFRGILAVLSTRKHAFTVHDERLLTLFANQAAIAMENARLFEETRHQTTELARSNTLINALSQVAARLQTSRDPAHIMETVGAELKRLGNESLVALVEPDQEGLSVRYTSIGSKPLEIAQRLSRIRLSDFRFTAANFLAYAEVIGQRRAAFVPDSSRGLTHLVPALSRPIVSRIARLLSIAQNVPAIYVPLLAQDRLLGMLGVWGAELNRSDVPALSVFANQVAVALENARLFEIQRRRNVELEALRRASLRLTSSLELSQVLEQILKHALELVAANEAYIFLYDGARLTFGAALFADGSRKTSYVEPREGGVTYTVARRGVRIVVPDGSQHPIFRDGPWKGAIVGLPLSIGDHVRGVMDVAFAQPRAFDENELRVLELLADQAAVALENARLFDETRRRLAELEAVNRISTALRQAQTVEEMTPRLLDEALAILSANSGSILLYQAERESLARVYVRGMMSKLPMTPIRISEGIAGRVFRTGEPYVAREFTTDPMTRESARGKIPPGWGGVCIPIRTTREIIGVFFVAVELPRVIQESEVHLLTTLAEIAGNAIHRAMLNEQTELRLRRLDALHSIDTAITASLDLRVTLGVILDQLIAQMRVDAADVLLVNPNTQILEYAMGRGFESAGVERTRVRVGQDFAGRAALERRTIRIPDLAEAGAITKFPEFVAAEKFVAYYALPLVAKGQVKGVLEIFHRARLEPDSEWLEFVAVLAGQAALAIDNTALFDGLQRSNAEIAMAYDATIESWARMLDLRDHRGRGHTQRVVETTLRIARALAIPDADQVHIRRGALLHHIGTMGIPDHILFKKDPLTLEEEEIIRKHPEHARELLDPITTLRPALDIPYAHHERWDGTGYPRGLKGDQIPLAARIFAVADCWEELLEGRANRPALSIRQAREYVQDAAGKAFDPKIVQTLLRVIA